MATTTEIATLLATHHAELQRDLAEHHRKIIAQLEHIAILVQPAPQVRYVKYFLKCLVLLALLKAALSSFHR
jgi:hypothetical protein